MKLTSDNFEPHDLTMDTSVIQDAPEPAKSLAEPDFLTPHAFSTVVMTLDRASLAGPLNRKAAMNKRQLIEAIRVHNTSVETAFLVQFAEADLAEYLCRLEAAGKKQRLIAGWVRGRQPMRLAS